MKKIIHRFLPLVAAILLAPTSTWALHGGDGKTLAQAIEIQDVADLSEFAALVNAGTYDGVLYSFGNIYVKLTADIDASTFSTHIGEYDEHPFSGFFDGGGHTIYNLNLSRTDDKGTGLFGYIAKVSALTPENPEVKDLIIENAHLTSTGSNVGILAGYIATGIITNVDVLGTNTVETTGSVIKKNVGGLIGYMQGGTVSDCDIKNVTVTAQTTTRKVGALLGGITPGVTFSNNTYDIHTKIYGLQTFHGTNAPEVWNYWNTRKAEVMNLMPTYGVDVRPGIAIGTDADNTKPFDLAGKAQYVLTDLTATVAGTYVYNFGEVVVPVWGTTGLLVKDDGVEIPHEVYAGTAPDLIAITDPASEALLDANILKAIGEDGDITTAVKWAATNASETRAWAPTLPGTVNGTIYLRNGEKKSFVTLYTISKYDISSPNVTSTIDPTSVTYRNKAYTVLADNTGDIKLTVLQAAYTKYDGTDATFNFLDPSTLDTYFSITPNTGTDVGNYDFVINGIGDLFTGTITKNWAITQLELQQTNPAADGYVEFANIANYTYNGDEKKPTPNMTVKFPVGGGADLVLTGSDANFSYTYARNVLANSELAENQWSEVKVTAIKPAYTDPYKNLSVPAAGLIKVFMIDRKHIVDNPANYTVTVPAASIEYDHTEHFDDVTISLVDKTWKVADKEMNRATEVDGAYTKDYDRGTAAEGLISSKTASYFVQLITYNTDGTEKITKFESASIKDVLYDPTDGTATPKAYKIRFYGVGNYDGYFDREVLITPIDLSSTPDANITIPQKIYNTQTQVASGYTVKDKHNVTLVESTGAGTTENPHNSDFYVSKNEGGIHAGWYDFEIKASPRGNYTGTKLLEGSASKGFRIYPKNLDNTDIVAGVVGSVVPLFKKPNAYNESDCPKYPFTGSQQDATVFGDLIMSYNWINGSATGTAKELEGTPNDAELGFLYNMSDASKLFYKWLNNSKTEITPAQVLNAGTYYVRVSAGSAAKDYIGTIDLKFIIEPQHINSKYVKVAFADATVAGNEVKTKNYDNGIVYDGTHQDPQLHVWYDTNENNVKDGTEYELVLGTDYTIDYKDFANTHFDGLTGDLYPMHARRVDVVLTGINNWDNVNDGTDVSYEEAKAENPSRVTTHGGYYYKASVATGNNAAATFDALVENYTAQKDASGIHYWIEPKDINVSDALKMTHTVKVSNGSTITLDNTDVNAATAQGIPYNGVAVNFSAIQVHDQELAANLGVGLTVNQDFNLDYLPDCILGTGHMPQNVKRNATTDEVEAYDVIFKSNGLGNYKNGYQVFYKITPKHIGNADTYAIDDEAAGITFEPTGTSPIAPSQEFTNYYIVDQAGASFIDKNGDPQTAVITGTGKNATIWKNYTTSVNSPAIVVKDGSTVLTRATGTTGEHPDYTIVFKKNFMAGIAEIEVTGKGNYDFNFKKTFEISKMKVWGIDVVNILVPEVDVLLDHDAPITDKSVSEWVDRKIVVLYGKNDAGELIRLNGFPGADEILGTADDEADTRNYPYASAWVEWMTWKDETNADRTGWKAKAGHNYTVTAKVWLGDCTAAGFDINNPATWGSDYYEFGDPLNMPDLRINSKQVNSQIHTGKNITIDYTFIKTAGQPEYTFNPETRRLSVKGAIDKDANVKTYLVFKCNDDDHWTIRDCLANLDAANQALYDSTDPYATPYYTYEMPPFQVNTNVQARIDYQKELPDILELDGNGEQMWISTIEEVSRGKVLHDKFYITAAPAVGQIGNKLYAEQIDAQDKLASLPDAVRPIAQISNGERDSKPVAGYNISGEKIYYIKTVSDTDEDQFTEFSTHGELPATIDWHLGLKDNKGYEGLTGDDLAKQNTYFLGRNEGGNWMVTEYTGDNQWTEYDPATGIDLTADPKHRYTTYYFLAKNKTISDPTDDRYDDPIADPHYGYSEITKFRAENMNVLTADHEWKTFYAKEKYTDYDGVTEKWIEGYKVLGAEVYNITAADANAGTITITDKQAMLPAEQPALLNTPCDGSTIYLSSLRYKDDEFNGYADAAAFKAATAPEFKGSEEETAPDFGQYDYFVLNNEEFVKVNSTEDPASKIPAFRSWLQFAAGSYPALARLAIVFDEADAVKAVKVESLQQGDWYDLNGRKLDNVPARKGVYIFNGRKVVIK